MRAEDADVDRCLPTLMVALDYACLICVVCACRLFLNAPSFSGMQRTKGGQETPTITM